MPSRTTSSPTRSWADGVPPLRRWVPRRAPTASKRRWGRAPGIRSGSSSRGPEAAVIYDGARLFTVRDETLRDAGKVGVWSKADSVTQFDSLQHGDKS